MDRARAMYLGGKEIYADDKHLNYYSYKDLGLRCSVCGEPVHLKKGLNKKTHFAHFPITDSKQVQECELRLYSHTESTQKFLENFSVTRGQKLELFQIYLISLITSNNYSNAIKIVKTSIENVDFLEEMAKDFRNNLFILKKKIVPRQLQDKVALEVIDYLCVESSSFLLKELICYSLYQVYNSSSDNWSFWIQKNNYFSIFSKLIETLINTPWLEVLHFTYRESINKDTPISERFSAKLEKLPLAGHTATAYCPSGRKKDIDERGNPVARRICKKTKSLFRAFHAVSFKLGGKEGSLLLLRDLPKENRGTIFFLTGEIPHQIALGGKVALEFIREAGQAVAELSVVDGEAFILPPMIPQKEEKEGKNNTKVEVMLRGSYIDPKLEKACHKLFDKMDIIEQTRYCSVAQILALEVSASIKEQTKLSPADKPEDLELIRKDALKSAEHNVKKQLSSVQRDLLQKRLGTHGIVPRLIEAEVIPDKPIEETEKQLQEVRTSAVAEAKTNIKKQLSSAQLALLQKRLGTHGIVPRLIEAEVIPDKPIV